MKNSQLGWLSIAVGLALLGRVTDTRADEKKEKQEKQQSPAAKPKAALAKPNEKVNAAEKPVENPRHQVDKPTVRPNGPVETPKPVIQKTGDRPKPPGERQLDKPKPQIETPQPPLKEVKKGNVIERVSPSNKVRERTTVDKKTGNERTQHISPTGRIEREEVQGKDGTKQITHYDLGREKRKQVVHADGRTEVTEVHYNRDGQPRARETIVTDNSGKVVSRTVAVRQNLVIKNTTIVNNTTIVRNYHPGRFGFVYHPVVVRPVVFVSWYDPFWYTPLGLPIYHPFHYSWGWYQEPWYRCHAYYWEPYPVYAAPSYWVTDWLVAGYIADRYAVAASAAQTREEVRLAREDAEKARIAAEQARDAAEIAEAKAAQAAAEARAERAEARVAKAELEEAKRKELASKPNPNATRIDKETKDALKDQVEKTIAERKQFAEQSAKGANPVPPDVTAALADPKHIYPVSKTISVTRAEDNKPAGTLTAGDLLRVESGQEKALANATENTPINMRIITSKGEDDSVPAGTVIAVPLKELQEFDNEFRAKIDLGLAEADANKDLFKKSVENQRTASPAAGR